MYLSDYVDLIYDFGMDVTIALVRTFNCGMDLLGSVKTWSDETLSCCDSWKELHQSYVLHILGLGSLAEDSPKLSGDGPVDAINRTTYTLQRLCDILIAKDLALNTKPLSSVKNSQQLETWNEWRHQLNVALVEYGFCLNAYENKMQVELCHLQQRPQPKKSSIASTGPAQLQGTSSHEQPSAEEQFTSGPSTGNTSHASFASASGIPDTITLPRRSRSTRHASRNVFYNLMRNSGRPSRDPGDRSSQSQGTVKLAS